MPGTVDFERAENFRARRFCGKIRSIERHRISDGSRREFGDRYSIFRRALSKFSIRSCDPEEFQRHLVAIAVSLTPIAPDAKPRELWFGVEAFLRIGGVLYFQPELPQRITEFEAKSHYGRAGQLR